MSWIDKQPPPPSATRNRPPVPAPGTRTTWLRKGDIPPRRAWWTFLVILLVNYLVVRALFPAEDQPIALPYTTFREEVAKNNVKAIYSQGASIEGRFKTPVTWPRPGTERQSRPAKPGSIARATPAPEPRTPRPSRPRCRPSSTAGSRAS